MAASFQETFIADVSRFSLGSACLFEPDSYRKGNALREPADLAWVCHHTVVLMYMQSGSASQEGQDRHNLRQAFGWLRAWHGGQALVGQNSVRDFRLPFHAIRSVLVVSVTSDPLAEVAVIPVERSKLAAEVEARLFTVASVPESILLQLAESGGAAVDLADMLLRVASLDGRVSVDSAREILAEGREGSRVRALTDGRVSRDRDIELDEWMHHNLSVELRSASSSERFIDGFNWTSITDVFADLDWQMRMTLTLVAADAFRMVRDVPVGEDGPTLVGSALVLPPYRVFVAAYDINKQASFRRELADAENQFRTTHAGAPIVSLHLHMVGRPKVEFASAMLIGGPQVEYTTVTESALAEVRALEPSAGLR